MKSNSLWTVTFFKGIAILMVILVHAAQMFALHSWVTMGFRFFQMGCQIFLILSSFTICMSLERRADTFWEYMKRRIGKILPGYWGMILLYLALAVGTTLLVNENIIRTDTEPLDVLLNVFLVHGLVPTAANNTVVRGGWFVGTIVILYLLTPFLFKIYKRMHVKNRWFCFPLICFTVGLAFVYVLGKIWPELECSNNSFMYFSFLNQIGCYSLGFSLWDLYQGSRIEKYRGSFFLFLLLGAVAVCVFYMETWKLAFCIEPMIFGMAFFHLFIWVQTRWGGQKQPSNYLVRGLMRFGELSFPIYLTHMLLAWEGSKLFKILLSKAGIALADMVIFILWIPCLMGLAFLLGWAYNKFIQLVKKITTFSDIPRV